jgi:hypothetical protein
MRLPIVDNRVDPEPSPLEYVRVSRTGGIMGVDEFVHVRRVGERYHTKVQVIAADEHDYELDSARAAELVSYLAQLIARSPADVLEPGADRYHWIVEVAWAGRVHRYEVRGVPTDDALRGVLQLASELMHAAGLGPTHAHIPPATSPDPDHERPRP